MNKEEIKKEYELLKAHVLFKDVKHGNDCINGRLVFPQIIKFFEKVQLPMTQYNLEQVKLSILKNESVFKFMTMADQYTSQDIKSDETRFIDFLEDYVDHHGTLFYRD